MNSSVDILQWQGFGVLPVAMQVRRTYSRMKIRGAHVLQRHLPMEFNDLIYKSAFVYFVCTCALSGSLLWVLHIEKRGVVVVIINIMVHSHNF